MSSRKPRQLNRLEIQSRILVNRPTIRRCHGGGQETLRILDPVDLARKLNVPYVDFKEHVPSTELLQLVPLDVLVYHCCCPVQESTDGTILLAMLDPGNVFALDHLAEITGRIFLPALARQELIEGQWHRLPVAKDLMRRFDSSSSFELPITSDCFDHTTPLPEP